MERLGITSDRQQYLQLPDSKLADFQDELADQIVMYGLANTIGHVVSLGNDGFDGHPDHIASHQAASTASRVLRQRFGKPVSHHALNADHRGDIIVPSTPLRRQRKLGAMACHASQFDIRPFATSVGPGPIIDGYAIGRDFWDSFAIYQPLIGRQETYDRI